MCLRARRTALPSRAARPRPRFGGGRCGTPRGPRSPDGARYIIFLWLLLLRLLFCRCCSCCCCHCSSLWCRSCCCRCCCCCWRCRFPALLLVLLPMWSSSSSFASLSPSSLSAAAACTRMPPRPLLTAVSTLLVQEVRDAGAHQGRGGMDGDPVLDRRVEAGVRCEVLRQAAHARARRRSRLCGWRCGSHCCCCCRCCCCCLMFLFWLLIFSLF